MCRRIRTWSDAPIVVLSADGSEDRKVDALDQGADGYMTKPFGMRELNARLKVALRHHIPPADSQPQELDVGALRLDLVHYEASLRGRSLDLTPREFDFLAYLARNAGKVCARRMILEHVWGPVTSTSCTTSRCMPTGYGASSAMTTGTCCKAIPRSDTGSRSPAARMGPRPGYPSR